MGSSQADPAEAVAPPPRRSADTRRGLALLAVGLLVLAACGGDRLDSIGEGGWERIAGLRDGTPEARFLPDPPLLGVRMAAGIDDTGVVGSALSFDATTAQVVAVVALGDVPEGSTLTVAWSRLGGADHLEPLFSHEVVVGPSARAYSVGVSGGLLAAGWYEVSAVLGEHEVATRWRVTDAEAVSHAFRLVSTSTTEPAAAQPPGLGDSGVWVDFFDAEAGQWAPRHFDEFPWHLDPLTGEPWREEPREAREAREPQPCALNGLWGGYEFFQVTVSVSLRFAADCDQETIDGITIVAAIVGSPVLVGTGSRAEFVPCALPGGTDKPGTIVHVVAWLPGQEADSVATEVEIEDLEALVVGLTSQPGPGSRVAPGQSIRLRALAMEMLQGPGIRSLEIHGPDGVLHAEEHESADCDPARHMKWIETTYTVPSDPPLVIELRAVVEDHAGRQDSDTITLVTEDAWTLTISSDTKRDYLDPDYNEPGKYQISPGECSDSWASEFTFVVEPDGTFTADGTATPTGGTACSFPMTAPPLTSRTLMISGTASADAFEFQIVHTGSPAGQGDYAAYASLWLDDGFAARTITLPRTGGDTIRAEHTYTLKDFSGPFDVYTSVNTFDLRRAQEPSG